MHLVSLVCRNALRDKILDVETSQDLEAGLKYGLAAEGVISVSQTSFSTGRSSSRMGEIQQRSIVQDPTLLLAMS